jgi:hypothetical protein
MATMHAGSNLIPFSRQPQDKVLTNKSPCPGDQNSHIAEIKMFIGLPDTWPTFYERQSP